MEVTRESAEGKNLPLTRLEIPREVYSRIRADITSATTGMRYIASITPDFMKARTEAIHRLLERCSADLSLIEIIPVNTKGKEGVLRERLPANVEKSEGS